MFAAAIALASVPGASAAAPVPPIDVLQARYRSELEALPPLGNVVFRYQESRSGPTHVREEEHRVYRRDDGEERNETLAVNGAPVVPAIVRLVSQPVWPYDVREFAVDTPEYAVLSLGATQVFGRRAYALSSVRTTPGDFAVTRVYLDALRFLPLREAFDVSGGSCAGSGTIDFAPADDRWLPTSVSVTCTVAPGGSEFKESISFSDYTFPQTLPPDVFGGRL